MHRIYTISKGTFHNRAGHENPEEEYRYSCTLYLTSVQGWGGWLTQRPGHFTPGRETRYPLYRRLGGPKSRYGRVLKISPTPGLDPRTAQLVASHCTDYAYRLLKAKYSHKMLVVIAEGNTSYVRLRLR
jgi:hypothetical protein